MDTDCLARIFEHNIWANQAIIQACVGLADDQLDAQPAQSTFGTIRETLRHLVASQAGYLQLLMEHVESSKRVELPLAGFEASAQQSGEGLLALAQHDAALLSMPRLRTTEDWLVEPWVVMLQAINHATEHREQIKSMLSALGVTPPSIDGWDFGEATGAARPPSAA
jgi:uncharacterized damage-inducible protein DinB